MKKQSKLNRFVDITARVIIGLLLCVAWFVICVKTPIWVLLIVLILDSPLYSKHGFIERALRALIHKEFIPWEESRPCDTVFILPKELADKLESKAEEETK